MWLLICPLFTDSLVCLLSYTRLILLCAFYRTHDWFSCVPVIAHTTDSLVCLLSYTRLILLCACYRTHDWLSCVPVIVHTTGSLVCLLSYTRLTLLCACYRTHDWRTYSDEIDARLTHLYRPDWRMTDASTPTWFSAEINLVQVRTTTEVITIFLNLEKYKM